VSLGNFHDQDPSVSQIHLYPLAAEAFPSFLDYSYADASPLQFDTENVTELHWLGDYFELPQLRRDVHFVQEDIDTANVDVYSSIQCNRTKKAFRMCYATSHI
jgi:hypothetical protein